MVIQSLHWNPGSQMQHLGLQPIWLHTKALTTTLEDLSKEQKQAIQKLANEWNEEGPPDEQKRK